MPILRYTATLRLAGSLEKSSEVMRYMQQLVKVPEIQATMQELSKEMMKVCKWLDCSMHVFLHIIVGNCRRFCNWSSEIIRLTHPINCIIDYCITENSLCKNSILIRWLLYHVLEHNRNIQNVSEKGYQWIWVFLP